MKIICGKTNCGKSTYLLKKFLEDKNSATFLSDEFTLQDIYNIAKSLADKGIDIIDLEGKAIETCVNVNCNSDYYALINNISTQSIYMDLSIPLDFRVQFKNFCVELENEYGKNMFLTEQLNANCHENGIIILDYIERGDISCQRLEKVM